MCQNEIVAAALRSFARYARGAVRAMRSLVHHSWVTREMDLLTLPSLRVGGRRGDYFEFAHAPRSDLGQVV